MRAPALVAVAALTFFGLLADPAMTRAAACDVQLSPSDDVVAAIDRAAPGVTICFTAGTYRLAEPIRPRAGQTLLGNGAVLMGSRRLTGFVATARGWTVGGQTQQNYRNGFCERGSACTYPDDVVQDGRALRRVLRPDRLTAGSYFFDYARNTITVHDDPAGHRLEAMSTAVAIVSRAGRTGADVTVSGFTVEYFATMAQHGAIETSAPGWTIADNHVVVNHGAGITSSGHVRIVANTVERNGQLGIGGNGDSTVVTDNEISGNNTAGFDPGWEAGGAKWALTDHLVVERNNVHDNAGPGLWTDIDAHDTTYADNIVTDNSRAGIFHEISTSAVIRGNTVRGNGHGFDTWLWGAGILLAGSHDVRVVGNQLTRNAAGIALIQQDRGFSEIDGSPRTLHDIAIRGNDVTMSGGPSGGVTDDGYDRMFTDPTISWAGDVWRGAAGTPFWWADDYLSLAEWHALGHDS